MVNGTTGPKDASLNGRMAVLRGSLALLAIVLFYTRITAQYVHPGDSTLTWEQAIAAYAAMAAEHPEATLTEIGKDDSGDPIHLFVLSRGIPPEPAAQRKAGRNVLLINNAIHAGEPDGVDASVMLARGLLNDERLRQHLNATTVCIIPVYNVSGARQRRNAGRANQNGPAEYGFRTNARNLDLNRDLMKMDARNTQALIRALRSWDPDVFVDTHVSNGSDHQYTMQLLYTHPDKLPSPLDTLLERLIVPELHSLMSARNVAMCDYFELYGTPPDSGLFSFFDHPRYTTGMAALYGILGFMSESHMLKPHAERVGATYELLLSMLELLDSHGPQIQFARSLAKEAIIGRDHLLVNWALDSGRSDEISFKGYEAVVLPSQVTGGSRLYYDHDRPFERKLKRFGHYRARDSIPKPKAYIIPQAWHEVIRRLAVHDVRMVRFDRDTLIQCEVIRITSSSGGHGPQEGRYRQHEVRTDRSKDAALVRAGDLLIPMGEGTDRFVMEALEPEAADSFFSWGFFDSIMQRKEYYSAYVFEDKAAVLLEQDTLLRVEFEKRRTEDPEFAGDAEAQLRFLYERSPDAEPGYRRYPILRVP
ncbi:MAG: hypothetical protein KDB88_13805 [Flavobacteriales bacterium]|nr:hypothetical protein [Flavobacteriales bacterium]